MFYYVDWWLYLVGLIPTSLMCFALWKKINKKEYKLTKENWSKGTVYLCQFPLVPKVRNISPFAIKLETWLRMHDIKYEIVSTTKFSKKGQIPYIELDGQEIADSNLIIEELSRQHNIDLTYGYDKKALSMGRLALATTEHHLAETGFYFRYGHNMEKFMDVCEIETYYPKGTKRFWGFVQPYITKLRSHMSGISRNEPVHLYEFACRDLRALSALLGDKQYFLGDRPSVIDCALFGHLAQFLFIDLPFPQKSCLKEECTNLVALVERMKKEYFPEDFAPGLEGADKKSN